MEGPLKMLIVLFAVQSEPQTEKNSRMPFQDNLKGISTYANLGWLLFC